MPRKEQRELATWYEAQYMLDQEDIVGWRCWEMFRYDTSAVVDSRKSQIRLKARHDAIRSSRSCRFRYGNVPIRVIHCEEIL